MLFLSSKNIESIVPVIQWVDTMEKALLSVSDDNYLTPDRTHVEIGNNTLLIMPSVGPQMFATKLVSVFPGNREKGIPVINGDVILNDSVTGETLAIMNGSKITAMRTAAVACVGLRKFTSSSKTSVGIIGAGEQGRHLAWFAAKMNNLQRVNVFDNSEQSISATIDFLSKRCPNTEVIVHDNIGSLIEDSSNIFTATTSLTPVLPNDPSLLSGKSIIAIGSYKPEMRELSDSIFSLSDKVWVDADFASKESGDLITPLQKGIINKSHIKNIKLLLENPGLLTGNTHIYKTVGFATFDLFAASMIYKEAHKKDIGIELKN